MTTAVRTGGAGAAGISVMVIDLNSRGVTRRKIKNSGWHAAESTWISLEDVSVPSCNLVGQENKGFHCFMKSRSSAKLSCAPTFLTDNHTDFNLERLIMSVGMNSMARACLEDAWEYSLHRETFGKPLYSNQIIRHKLATLARYIESHWAWIEQISYHAKIAGHVGDELASRIALAKVHGGRILELANREAQQIFGGAGYQRGGVGARVERVSRDLRVHIVGGGSEEIITDLAVRQETAAMSRKAKI